MGIYDQICLKIFQLHDLEVRYNNLSTLMLR